MAEQNQLPQFPQASASAPPIGDLFKFATSFLGNSNSNDNQLGSPLAFLNSPEFTDTVNSMTRNLLQSLTAPIDQANTNNFSLPVDENTSKTPRTRDLVLELNVTLEDLYRGKTKKVTVKRKRTYEQSDNSFKVVEERHVLKIKIEPGFLDNHRIVFNGEADQIPGFETGDVVVIIKQIEHDNFVRCFDDLLYYCNISISELYYFDTTLKLLDGTHIRLNNSIGDILSDHGSIRKIVGKGMPLQTDSSSFGDLFIQFNIIPHDKIIPSKESLCALFPPLNTVDVQCDAVVELSQLVDDDYYKLDLFEEDKYQEDYDEDYDDDEEDEEEEEEEEEEEDEEDEEYT